MRVSERKVVTVEMEAVDYGMFIDVLRQAARVRSRKYPILNEMATTLLARVRLSEENPDATS